MNEQAEFVRAIITRLEAAGVPYMICGSVASGVHGEPRYTQDLDVIIAPTEAQLRAFLGSLPDDWYTDEDTALQALKRRDMFNVIHAAKGMKADLIVRKGDAFSDSEFGRRVRVRLDAGDAYVAAAEDTVLSKLAWAKASGSERQLRDACWILVMRRSELDREYLSRWAARLEVTDLLDRITAEAERILKSQKP